LLESQHEELLQRLIALDKLETEFELVEQRGMSIRSALESTRIKIEEMKRRQGENVVKVEELHAHSHSSYCPLCSAPIVDRAKVVRKYEDDNLGIDKEISQLQCHAAELELERSCLRKQYLCLKQELETRKYLDTQVGQFNERLHAVERCEQALLNLRREHEWLCRRLEEQDFAQVERESLMAIRAEIIKLEFDPVEFAAIQSQIRADRHIEQRFQQLQKDESECKRLIERLPSLQAKSDELSMQLASESYASEVRDELHRIQDELGNLNYDQKRHMEMRTELALLLPQREKAKDLEHALKELPQIDEALAACQFRLKRKEEEQGALAHDLRGWADQLEAAPDCQREMEELLSQVSIEKEKKERVGKQLAVAEAQLDRLNEQSAALGVRRSELQSTRAEIEDLVFLAEAFGKKGIQAVIIENAIPEIEGEANRILSRLSDNKMHVALVTQQRTKSGGVVETLDLLIGDEVGTRNYELYSGGEAFKVNFAIRVALSRLLTRRSGAKLETLIIDEGFASQDDVSRDRLVKAIRSIQSEFERILVITHFKDVQDMFPAQILVSKRHGVSTFELVT
jgi:exonuclease SbcC